MAPRPPGLLQRRGRRWGFDLGQQALRIHAVEGVAGGAEFADHFDLATAILERRFHFLAAQRAQHAFHAFLRAGATEGQRLWFVQAHGFLVIEAIQQFLRARGEHLAGAERGREMTHAGPRLIVVFSGAVARPPGAPASWPSPAALGPPSPGTGWSISPTA